jgi:hypothetical protein
MNKKELEEMRRILLAQIKILDKGQKDITSIFQARRYRRTISPTPIPNPNRILDGQTPNPSSYIPTRNEEDIRAEQAYARAVIESSE